MCMINVTNISSRSLHCMIDGQTNSKSDASYYAFALDLGFHIYAI